MAQEQPIKFGDVFMVSEKIANKPIAPQDAAAMQSAESQVLGHSQRGGPASVMRSAAAHNVQAGLIPPGSASDVGKHQRMAVMETVVDGHRIITESIGDQAVAQYADMEPNPKQEKVVAPPSAVDQDAVTIGEALEASAISSADKPIDQSDAAAIQVAEMQAIGSNRVPSGGLGAEAHSAAARNAQIVRDEQKTTIGDILMDATARLADDKPVNVQDAERVIAAEVRNNPRMSPDIGGVADSVAAAARMNQQKHQKDE